MGNVRRRHRVNVPAEIRRSPDRRSASDGRLRSLDGLRGLAAVFVMTFHFNIFFVPQARLTDLIPFLDRGYLAVDLFFLLSGLVMAHVYGQALATDWRAQWTKFAIARFARIYPLFAVTTSVMAIAVAIFDTPLAPAIPISLSAGSLALQPFLLQQWASSGSWNYPSWSISTEAEAYIYFVFFAGLLLAGRRARLIAVGCIFIVAVLSLVKGGTLNYSHKFPALVRTLAEFSLGALLYRLYSSDAKPSRIWVVSSAVVLAGLSLVTHVDFLLVGAFGCLIYLSINARGALATALLNSRPSVALGKWSYSIYLWHAPVHYIVIAMFAAIGLPVSTLGLSGARLLLLATALVVVGLSAVSFEYFESPVRSLIVRRFPLKEQTK
jgi:peptidoglycan/LPS O-acetylase OafA/YrhL